MFEIPAALTWSTGIARRAASLFVIVIATLGLGIGAAAAQQVILRAKGGDFAFSGRLKSQSTGTFVVETRSGEIALASAEFECIGNACPADAAAAAGAAEQLPIHGSNTIGAALMPALILGYASSLGLRVEQTSGDNRNELRFRVRDSQRGDQAAIDLQHYGSGSGLAALAKGAAAIAMSSRVISDSEARALAPRVPSTEIGRNEHVIGLDAIVVIVARDNPLKSLTIDQIARVFSGQLTDWQQLGLAPAPITVFAAEAGSGAYDAFSELVLRPRNLVPGALVRRLEANAELVGAVAADPHAIGFASLASARRVQPDEQPSVQPVAIQGTCGLVTDATAINVKTEEYPLSRRLYLYTAGQPHGAFARGLLDFSLAAGGQAVVKGARFVDQSIDTVTFVEQSRRYDANAARALVGDVGTARRLSVAVRFASGSSDFQSKSRADIARLADFLLAAERQRKPVVLAGFSDQLGTPVANARLSRKRADQVRTALLAATKGRLDPRLIVAKGYGALAPVACNDTANGQQLNRRVEVWIKG